ncbi:PPOX class F420-dependent oxidoreductase [Streptomyces hainanensis]|uniref:PPOX class F420-dependent oxidoreductase n=1 Tax=Streptomyces hainanensis TaxID=402648 RepID=A0A4V2Y2Y4_9ACTN|nr:PPOX class F420-dependent oxidoreductase [Streptomyces hainanensis]TDC74345.1 PPOX class F420-dependent oxidoreductase [Streptomyces hainanensis]
MAQTMSEPEWRAFVSAGTRTAKLATVRADGSPHLAPVWFLLDGDDVVLNTGANTVKGRNLARDGRAALCVDDETPPFAFVVIHGRATLSEDPAELLTWATRIGGRYMGEDEGERLGARNAVPGELLVRLRIEKVVAYSALAD